METLNVLIEALAWLFAFLLIGALMKRMFFAQLIIPSSLIGGLLAFIFSPHLIGAFVIDTVPKAGAFWLDERIIEVWKALPSYLIVVVFAGIFLGKKLPSLKQVIRNSSPNLAFGYTLALGQYIVGILAVALVIQHLFDVEPVAGALIAVAFQGGHGTVAGLSSTFTELGFEQAQTIGLGLATIGLITAIIFGTIISNQFVKKDAEPEISHNEKSKIDINPVNYSMQLALLAFVILLGYFFLLSLQQAESWLLGDADSGFFKYMPLFPIAMLAGLVIQKLAEKYKQAQHISQYHINITSNLALDLLIVSALGSLSLSTLSQQWAVILMLGLIGVVFNLTIYFAFAKYFFKKSWRIRGIGEIGQSMGTTAVGLLLLKQASAEDDTHVKAFSHKQPLYEPIVGGGLVTAIAVPAIASTNPWYFLTAIIASLAIILSTFFWYQNKVG